METLVPSLREIFEEDNLVMGVLSKKRMKSAPIEKVKIKLVKIKEDILFQFELFDGKQVQHLNLNEEEAIEKTYALLNEDFLQGSSIVVLGTIKC